jgi:hypothetical protein
MPINRAPFNALIDDDGSTTSGTPWNKTQIKNVLLDPVDAFVGNGGVWGTYAPIWAGADNVGPTGGNCIISGRYLRIGQWVDVAIIVVMGSTTTYGTSTYWTFSLPFLPVFVSGAPNQSVFFRAAATSAGGAAQPAITAYVFGSACYLITQAGALVNPTTPFVWSAGAMLSIRGTYEI